MNEPTYEGTCLCGDVRYRASGTATYIAYCHCRSCRGASGAPMVAWATFDKSAFQFTAGTPATNASSEHVRRTFCPRCGTALTYEHAGRPDQIDVTLATLVDPGNLRPKAHLWVSHKLPWVELTDSLPHYAEWGIAQ